ncbi:ATP-dependent endonuclease, partial [Mesorhizobium sp. M2D.F.Ca.ET.145.01.1.1]
FLQRRLANYFTHRYYVLDPAAISAPVHGVARPQALNGNEPIEGDPFKGLIRIDEISAQRGFGNGDDGFDDDKTSTNSGSRKLSTQLRQYYAQHLDPYEQPDARDLHALRAIEQAQQAFDGRLTDSFE